MQGVEFDNGVIYVFFFNAAAPAQIYTLSLHDALPISLTRAFTQTRAWRFPAVGNLARRALHDALARREIRVRDRKSTRLNSSHVEISYAVFCLKKKKNLPIRMQGIQFDNRNMYVDGPK